MGLKVWRIIIVGAMAILLTTGFAVAHKKESAATERAIAPSAVAAPFEQYPPAPLPGWVKFQWLSWYDVGMGVNESHLKAEIDYIAENLSDLGPWHILVDAGWYVAEGRSSSNWRNVDRAKFPSGLRALVDYAHSRGVRVVLYISVPYLNDANVAGNWLGLRGLADQHPDWLIPLGAGNVGNGYLYNFGNPELRAYMTEVIRDFFVTYDVDGIKVDGFGDADREVAEAVKRGTFTQDNKPSLQSTEIYEFIYRTVIALKPDAYIEAGWYPPPSARSYVHTVRYGDEYPAFDYPYPSGGLRQHLDYAITQRTQLGERPNIGAIWGNANDVSVGYQWLEAGLALSSQVVLGFDLPSLNGNVLDGYRARLSQYNAFQAEPIVGGSPDVDTFASRTNRTTYLGTVNRDDKLKVKTVSLGDYGLDPNRSYLVYDVTSDSFFRTSGSLTFEVPPERFRLFLLRDEIGVMWTNGSFRQEYTPGQLKVVLDGPPSLTAYVYIHTPPFAAVHLDGVPLENDQYRFDSQNHVLTLVFGYNRQREVRIVY